MSRLRFADIEREIVAEYGRGRYDAALAVLDRAGPHLGAHWERVAYWRACLLARQGHHREAVDVLSQSVEAGAWWAPRLLELESDLDPLWDDERYRQLLHIMDRRRKTWAPSVSGLWLDGETGGLPFLGLHGRNQIFETDAACLANALGPGWQVAIPESAERIAADGPVWDDADRCFGHVRRVTADLWGEAPFAIGGFSQGARRALQFGLGNGSRVRAVLAVAPMVLRSTEIAEVVGSLAGPPWPQVVILAGEDDPATAGAATIVRHLAEEGIHADLRLSPAAGHEWIQPSSAVSADLARTLAG